VKQAASAAEGQGRTAGAEALFLPLCTGTVKTVPLRGSARGCATASRLL